VATNVSVSDYENWREENEKVGCKCCLQVLAFFLSRSEWDRVGIRSATRSSWTSNNGNTESLSQFLCKHSQQNSPDLGETDLRDGAGGFVTPDCCLIPVGRPMPPIGTRYGNGYLTVVVEVGITQTIPRSMPGCCVFCCCHEHPALSCI
jgi:hypothetical protein